MFKAFLLLTAFSLPSVAPLAAQGQTGSYTLFGSGCKGTPGFPARLLAPVDLPMVYAPFTLRFDYLPTSPGLLHVVFGFSKTLWGHTPLPYDLTHIGLTGCTVFISVDIPIPVTYTGTVASLTIDIPNNASLRGLVFFNQALVVDPGINAYDATVTNAGEGTIGY